MKLKSPGRELAQHSPHHLRVLSDHSWNRPTSSWHAEAGGGQDHRQLLGSHHPSSANAADMASLTHHQHINPRKGPDWFF